ncbi:hypothetical protein [Rhizobium lusitanum]|uniref:Sulfotransferase family protein n=1 Tax=Rhizobium lusitanum TaxID=293958 RepID=A0A1C3XFH8_9HYPH|nr:hypothetical protein [Rhizobium lusitanum]SCB50969.1 hypothetical protein GA0061101_1368 [Rhizobium lusitanum]
MATNRKLLHDNGALYYEGVLNDQNHVDLHVVSIRPDRETPFKRLTGAKSTPELVETVRSRISDALSKNARLTVFSNEGISLIAHKDEALRLKSLFPNSSIKILVYLRKKEDFLASYRAQMENLEYPRVVTRDSYAYTKDDTWLLDYQKRLSLFRTVFGGQNVVEIDYDNEMQFHGSVIPSFIEFIGAKSLFSASDWQRIWLNTRSEISL